MRVLKVLIAGASFLWPYYLAADQIDICGKAIPVEQAVQVDGSNWKIVIANKAQVLPYEQAVLAVLNSELAKADFKNPAGWKELLEECIKQKKPAAAALSFLLYATAAKQSDTINYDFLDSVFLSPQRPADAAKRALQHPLYRKLDPRTSHIALLSVVLEDVHWVRAQQAGGRLSLTEEFKSFAENRLAEALKVKDITLAKAIAARLETLFVFEAEKYRKLTLACNLIEELLSSGSRLSAPKLLTLVSLRNTDQSLRPVLDPFLVDGFHTLAQDALENGKFEEALSMISSINPDQATPTTYELISKTIEAINPEAKIFSNESVNEALLEGAQNQPQLKERVADLYYRRTLALIKRFHLYAAHTSADYFSKLSDDKDKHHSINFNFASAYLRSGQRAAAEGHIAKFSPGILERLSFFIDGYYGNPIIYVLFILVPLVLKLSYEFVQKMTTPRHPAAEDWQEASRIYAEQAAEEAQGNPNFVSSRMSKVKNPLVEEYTDCLAVFELKRGVDLKTIKTAYRNAVRKIHPDLNTGVQSPEDASLFVSLTKTYDRLRELHRLLGLDEK